MIVDFGKALEYYAGGQYRKLQDGEEEVMASCKKYLLTSFKQAESELAKNTTLNQPGFKSDGV